MKCCNYVFSIMSLTKLSGGALRNNCSKARRIARFGNREGQIISAFRRFCGVLIRLATVDQGSLSLLFSGLPIFTIGFDLWFHFLILILILRTLSNICCLLLDLLVVLGDVGQD
ncbi:hypothetical protein L1987_11299 [Smallanthus sonchifolius]|uniref:Uncharacterized protein n=1 Tax=Smallanthus sonchifolius TaxID=185202 RepID=A0ACB9JAX6_9ASTR|nr:hypothetical protein L1987_11299 [Smallanthus sonchifolius]